MQTQHLPGRQLNITLRQLSGLGHQWQSLYFAAFEKGAKQDSSRLVQPRRDFWFIHPPPAPIKLPVKMLPPWGKSPPPDLSPPCRCTATAAAKYLGFCGQFSCLSVRRIVEETSCCGEIDEKGAWTIDASSKESPLCGRWITTVNSGVHTTGTWWIQSLLPRDKGVQHSRTRKLIPLLQKCCNWSVQCCHSNEKSLALSAAATAQATNFFGTNFDVGLCRVMAPCATLIRHKTFVRSSFFANKIFAWVLIHSSDVLIQTPQAAGRLAITMMACRGGISWAWLYDWPVLRRGDSCSTALLKSILTQKEAKMSNKMEILTPESCEGTNISVCRNHLYPQQRSQLLRNNHTLVKNNPNMMYATDLWL